MSNENIVKIADLVENFLALLDEEMEHGNYSTPEDVPFDYSDEGDSYWDNHNKIVNDVVSARAELENYLKNFKHP